MSYLRPGYHLASFDQAASILQNLAEEESDAVKLLFDVFHCQILHGPFGCTREKRFLSEKRELLVFFGVSNII